MSTSNQFLVEALRTFIVECPFLSDGRVNVDYRGVSPTEYSIDGTPVEKIVKRYIDGSSIRQFAFVFGSVERYGMDVLANIQNSGFYEDFSEWLDKRTRAKRLPDLGKGRDAISISAQSTGYLFDNGDDTARYQVQCRLIYFQDK